MVGRVQRKTGLVVEFRRDGATPQSWPARDPRQAARVVVAACADIRELYDGDRFVVRMATDDDDGLEQKPPDLPEPNRSSHYS
jgi:hypothetical protein